MSGLRKESEEEHLADVVTVGASIRPANPPACFPAMVTPTPPAHCPTPSYSPAPMSMPYYQATSMPHYQVHAATAAPMSMPQLAHYMHPAYYMHPAHCRSAVPTAVPAAPTSMPPPPPARSPNSKKPIQTLPLKYKERGKIEKVGNTYRIVGKDGTVVNDSLQRHHDNESVPIITWENAEALNPLKIVAPPKGEIRRVKLGGTNSPFRDVRILFVPTTEDLRKRADEVDELFSEARRNNPKLFMEDTKAGGKYIRHGIGSMPGRHTSSLTVPGETKKNVRPFVLGLHKRPEDNIMLKKIMFKVARMMGWAAERISKNFPGLLKDISKKVRRKGMEHEDAFMFPTQYMQLGRGPKRGECRGAETAIPSHAVAVRMDGLVGLHCDDADSKRKKGAPMLYVMGAKKKVDPHKVDPHPLPNTDLLISATKDGGACVRVQTACPHHMAVICFNAADHLHSNFFENDGTEPLCKEMFLVRIVPYCKEGIDRYMDAFEATMPPKENEEMEVEDWEKMIPKGDGVQASALRNVMLLEGILKTTQCSGILPSPNPPPRTRQQKRQANGSEGSETSRYDVYLKEFGQPSREGRKEMKGQNNFYETRETSGTNRAKKAAEAKRRKERKDRLRKRNKAKEEREKEAKKAERKRQRAGERAEEGLREPRTGRRIRGGERPRAEREPPREPRRSPRNTRSGSGSGGETTAGGGPQRNRRARETAEQGLQEPRTGRRMVWRRIRGSGSGSGGETTAGGGPQRNRRARETLRQERNRRNRVARMLATDLQRASRTLQGYDPLVRLAGQEEGADEEPDPGEESDGDPTDGMTMRPYLPLDE